MKGWRKVNKVELTENRLILYQIYSTLLYFTYPPSLSFSFQTDHRYELHLLYPYITLQKFYFQLIILPDCWLPAIVWSPKDLYSIKSDCVYCVPKIFMIKFYFSTNCNAWLFPFFQLFHVYKWSSKRFFFFFSSH